MNLNPINVMDVKPTRYYVKSIKIEDAIWFKLKEKFKKTIIHEQVYNEVELKIERITDHLINHIGGRVR